MEKILGFIGMFAIVGITYLFSSNKKEINWKSVSYAFIAQIVLAVLLIKTPLWKCVEWLSNGVAWVLAQANDGINFVFGGLVPTGGFVFFINSLLPIVFISALMGLLFHFGILQKCIQGLGNSLARFLNVDTLAVVNGVANMFMGQTDSLFVTKSYLPSAKDSVIFATLVGGMTSISTAVVGLYASMGAKMEWIIISMPLTVFSTFVLTQILMPTKYSDEKIEVETNDKGVNAIETMMNYANIAFKSVIGITVALLVFLSIVALANNFIGLFFDGVTIQSILGIVFKPLAFLMGVSPDEVNMVSQILATKLVTNETVAFGLPQFMMLSENARAMVTVALCGFAGIGSCGILLGAYQAIAPNKVKVVAKLGMKALLCATAVNILTGTIVGLLL
ncbi:MAG: hypothetical protein J6D12_07790 [Peptostreptococcaceae bacterium]|nr:hypothetical protein [Peptostreptococcaceae bacterium]